MYLRLKTIKNRRYVYVVESRRDGGRIVQRSLACLGALDGTGRSLPSDFAGGSVPLPKGAAVAFKLLIQGDWRLMRGMVVDPREHYAIIKYPLLGELLEVQKPWSEVRAHDARLPLAGHGRDRTRVQTVLPV